MKNTTRRLISFAFFAIVMFIVIAPISAQEIIAEKTYNEFIRLNNERSIGSHLLTENDITGSPYLNQDFIIGSLLTTVNVIYKDIPLRYNIYNDDMEFKTGDDNYLAISNPKTMKEFRIGDDLFIYAYKKNKKGEPYGYYKVLDNGNIKLLLQYNVTFVDKTEPEPYKPAKPPKFQNNSNTYFFKVGSANPQQISKKKDIESIFGEKGNLILDFMKNQKIKFNEETDLVKLAKYINTL